MRKKLFLATLAFLFITLSVTAPRAEDNRYHLRFEFMVSGLHAGDFVLSYGFAPGEKTNLFQLETRGLIRWVTKLRVKAKAEGSIGDDSKYSPALYEVGYTNRRRERTVTVTFDEVGTGHPLIQTKGEKPEDDKRQADKVEPQWRVGTIDPITAVVESIRITKDHLENGGPKTFTLPVYDGRRRFDVEGEVGERLTRHVRRADYDVYRLILKPVPRAGFKDSHTELWSKFTFHIYLSADGQYIPIQIDAVGPGPVINLTEQCKSQADCLAMLEE